MTANPLGIAGAASHGEVDWDHIDWTTVDQNVKRLQTRIVKATKEGRWGKVKALQRLLTHSFSGKALAVERVTENKGKRTPGVDRVTWNSSRSKGMAILSLKQRGYKPLPLRRILIPKSNGKMRPLGIPAMQDRAMQALYLLALDPIAETTADPNSYGFRRGRGCADAIGQCHLVLCNRLGPKWILEGDIKSCFDKIDHDWLLANVPMDRAILRKWLKSGYLDKHVFHQTEEGTPQGGVASPVLANLTLDGLEKRIRKRFPIRTIGRGIHLIRYADDFVITGRTKEILENEVKPLVEQFMRERGLELSEEKTTIVHIDDGFDFLGQTVRSWDGKLLAKPSKRSVKAFLKDIRNVIKENKQATAHNLIVQLNPKIQGWVNYHRHVSSKRTFAQIDTAIFRNIWRWALRRHPQKSRHWVANKYFGNLGGRNWVFFGEVRKEKGQPPTRNWLKIAAKTPIRYHIKVKAQANPYDPAWSAYFEARNNAKRDGIRGKRVCEDAMREPN